MWESVGLRYVQEIDCMNTGCPGHYETMEEGRAVWLGIYLNNGKIYHLNIGGDNLWVNYSDETVD